jgi:ABC-type lipoprotein export system ATPase subunit
VANGKVEQAEAILKKAAAMNKVNEDEVMAVFRSKVLHVNQDHHINAHLNAKNNSDFSTGTLVVNKEEHREDAEELQKYGFVDFFRNKYVFLCAAINGFVW